MKEKQAQTPYGFILRHHKAPGDTVVFTALVRDVAAAYQSVFVDARVHWTELLQHSPHITSLQASRKDVKFVQLQYKEGLKRANNEGPKIHFLLEFFNDFERQTGLRPPLQLPRPDLHFGKHEHSRIADGRYWVVVAGGKSDVPLKVWEHARYQQVVDGLAKMGLGVVQCGAVGPLHRHQPLQNVVNLVGRTNLREFMRLIRDADGVICPITAAMHIAAALEKPCVVLAGGREAPWWEAYDPQYGGFGALGKLIRVPHKYLHTIGQLDCCKDRGCWKNKLVWEKPEDLLCRYPKTSGRQHVAQCMLNITSDQVLQAVEEYYRDGLIAPLPINVNQKLTLTQDMPVKDVHETARPTMALPTPPPAVGMEATGLQHPLLGGKLTVFVLCYGDYLSLHKRCLESILNTLPANQLDLRVGANACSQASLEYLAGLPITKLYSSPENRKKYPVMREMFYDPDCPITTKYVCWFDDDSYACNTQWVARLSECIVNNHPHGSRLYGIRFVHRLDNAAQANWFRQASWFHNVNWQMMNGAGAPNGNCIPFVAGGFWALATECLRQTTIPDVRLNHNGGDITIGAQVHQLGYKIKDFNRDKVYVFSSGAPRRGYEEVFPWRTTSPK